MQLYARSDHMQGLTIRAKRNATRVRACYNIFWIRHSPDTETQYTQFESTLRSILTIKRY
jgi:hypothetical protein